MDCKFSLLLKGLTIVTISIGLIVQQLGTHLIVHGASAFLYFTTQSNLALLIMTIVLLVYEIKRIALPEWLKVIHHVVISAVLLTYIVFSLFLGPFIKEAFYFYSATNLTLHNLGPILGITTYLAMQEKSYNPKLVFFGLISGGYYLIFAYTVHLLGGTFGSVEFPYFFLDYKTSGWLTITSTTIGVVYWFVIIALILWGLSALLVKLSRKQERIQHLPAYNALVMSALSILIITTMIIIK